MIISIEMKKSRLLVHEINQTVKCLLLRLCISQSGFWVQEEREDEGEIPEVWRELVKEIIHSKIKRKGRYIEHI